jgi:hypothetical protein
MVRDFHIVICTIKAKSGSSNVDISGLPGNSILEGAIMSIPCKVSGNITASFVQRPVGHKICQGDTGQAQ